MDSQILLLLLKNIYGMNLFLVKWFYNFCWHSHGIFAFIVTANTAKVLELFRLVVFASQCLRFTYYTIVIFTESFIVLYFESVFLFAWTFSSSRFWPLKYQYYLKRWKNKEKLGFEQVFIAIFFSSLVSFYSKIGLVP